MQFQSFLTVLLFPNSLVSKLAVILLSYTIVTTYSVACPLIAPAGLLYMSLNYLLARYQIYYMFAVPEILTVDMLHTAIFIVFFANLMLLLQLAGFLFTDPQSFRLDFNPATIMMCVFVGYIFVLVSFRGFIKVEMRHSKEADATPMSAIGDAKSSKLDKVAASYNGSPVGQSTPKHSTNPTSSKKVQSDKQFTDQGWIDRVKVPTRSTRKVSGCELGSIHK